MILYYDRKGKPINDVLEWGRLLEDFKYKIVKQEYLSDGKWISTVWLGLDHGFLPNHNKPLIFETMVFPKKGEFGDLDMARYSTEAEAKLGHKNMVGKWKAKIKI